MPEQKGLEHQDFWDQMKKVARQVDRWPDWEKGSPTNKRVGTQSNQSQQAENSPEKTST
jgi:hypothetical protein